MVLSTVASMAQIPSVAWRSTSKLVFGSAGFGVQPSSTALSSSAVAVRAGASAGAVVAATCTANVTGVSAPPPSATVSVAWNVPAVAYVCPAVVTVPDPSASVIVAGSTAEPSPQSIVAVWTSPVPASVNGSDNVSDWPASIA